MAVTERSLNVMLVGTAGVAAISAAAFLLGVPVVIGGWPFTVTPLTHTFLASLALAFALPLVWIARTRDYGAILGIAAAVAIGFLGSAARLLPIAVSEPRLWPNAAFAVVVGVAGLAAYAWAGRRPIRDDRPTPLPVRLSFAGFAAILILAGVLMILETPNVLPWRIDLHSQALVGSFFVGAAAYFLVGVARPSWGNAAGQLMSFLIYDIVLFVPLASQLGTVRPEHRLALLVYLGVLVYSALLASYYFLIDPQRRVVAR